MIFHDTNMGLWYRSLDGLVRRGWYNQRGVIRAVEERFGRRYDEGRYFVDGVDAPWCNGLTVLRRLEQGAAVIASA